MVTIKEDKARDISSKVNSLVLSSGGKRRIHPGNSTERERWTDTFEGKGDLRIEAESTLYRSRGGTLEGAGSTTKVMYGGRVVFREEGSKVKEYHPGQWEEKLDSAYASYKGERMGRGVSRTLAIFIGLFGGLFILSSNITGNVVSETAKTSSTVLGLMLLLTGLTGVFAFFKKSL